ncbi:hypothetical protein COS31_04820 [Candidatus Roizmanbacteria bacterium CG02_land_8_20_14_3_00_36_15]|uniref:Uncharacterized protein n=3 Tax=Candidatus Roizmaniibacteriota TaxID=1752723 RepID=A0A2M8F2U0_9BACT|nr:MAG: hypothetical protein COS51_01880 [Candidatus Roizmanbacteria bacterium CG03_land_8_20_14_0_80_36_21]PIV37488.1 MAG: hypothetical protein COS31_04820 [Candidatus Roizmanbacteria bacterium CG02_land_8_20_14_3_00_36_15]PIY70564.1 MAG: hypothetical protein COY89_00875 [Candidatus Roizmanbacteria bacterium CG_4_10_14_0_8_um_filter_36_36]PJA52472.1 MAG: hypothetical protein CO166_05725 [Candidatus Roizmanbacteria bacterium CG_4_9_14_3_um_filter_36_11]PJC33607.1 MAG: hypothetical protein CO049
MVTGGIPQDIREILQNNRFSQSERNGLTLITPLDLSVYSPGISTGGVAEIKMVLDNKQRRVTATTIDALGIAQVRSTLKF